MRSDCTDYSVVDPVKVLDSLSSHRDPNLGWTVDGDADRLLRLNAVGGGNWGQLESTVSH